MLSKASKIAITRLVIIHVMVIVAIFPKRYSACKIDLQRNSMLNRNAYVKFRIMRNIYSVLFHSCLEINWDNKTATAKPAIDSMATVFVTVFWVAVASSVWFFPNFSEMNLVNAVGNASRVSNEKVEAKKLRIDKVPMSVWVRTFVFVTIM